MPADAELGRLATDRSAFARTGHKCGWEWFRATGTLCPAHQRGNKSHDHIEKDSAPHRGRTKQSVAASAAMLATYMAGPLLTSPALAVALFPDLEVVSQSSAKNSNSSKSVTVKCPVGKAVINAGADINNGGGSVAIEKMIPDAAYTAVTVAAFETDPTPLSWTIRAIASCATAPVGLVWTFVQSPVNSLDKKVTATCPAGKTLLGGGAQLTNGWATSLLTKSNQMAMLGLQAQRSRSKPTRTLCTTGSGASRRPRHAPRQFQASKRSG